MDTTSTETEVSFSDQMLKESGMAFAPPAAGAEKPAAPAEGKPEAEKQAPPAEIPAAEKEKTPGEEKKTGDTAPAGDGTPPATAPEAAPTDDIDDEKLLAALRKKTGRDIRTLDELTTPAAELTEEQKQEAAEARRSAAIKFGTEQKLFSQTQYDNYVTFSAKDKLDVVQEAFIAEAKKLDPSLSDQDAEDFFAGYYHTMEDPDSILYKRSQAEIDRQYEAIKQQQFGPILKVTEQYDNYQENTRRAQGFTSQIDKLFSEKLPSKFDFTIDGETLSFPVDLKNKKVSEMVSEIKQNYLTVEMMHSTLDQTGKVDEAALLKEISKDLQFAVMEGMVSEIAKSYAATQVNKARMGRRGVMELDLDTNRTTPESTAGLSESDKMLAEAGYPVNGRK